MSTGAEEAGIGMLMLVAAFIIVCIAALSLVRSQVFIYSSRDGRGLRTQQMIRVSVKRIVVSVALMTAFGYAVRYWRDAQLRSLVRSTDCDSEQSADGRYTARYCYLREKVVLRLYDRESQELLAERTYQDHSHVPVRLHWRQDALRYEDDDGLGTIPLPPLLHDRFLARLP